MKAKHAGTCPICKGAIVVGQTELSYYLMEGRRRWVCCRAESSSVPARSRQWNNR